jgi:hypothetical protein
LPVVVRDQKNETQTTVADVNFMSICRINSKARMSQFVEILNDYRDELLTSVA